MQMTGSSKEGKALDFEGLAGGLAAACERHFGEAGSIEALQRLTGGASQETWSFDFVTSDGGRCESILRRNVRSEFQNLDAATEFALVAAAERSGVPVPPLQFLLDERDGLGQGYVMERVAGETIPRRILRDARYAEVLPKMAAQAGEILARIHAVDVAGIEGLPAPPAAADPTMAQLANMRELSDRFGEPHPTFELALRWLEDAVPDDSRVGLVHGDFRNGNFIVGPDGICAVLDWELAHLGSPIEDLGWLCVRSWRFGVDRNTVGGFGSVEDLCDAYTRAGGSGADPEAIRYWIVYGTLRWGVICQVQASAHRRGLHRSVELAAIGRRVCEVEWDLLDLIT
jgi:aminoglycoside phosphotransferase (APT) family kinase protein